MSRRDERGLAAPAVVGLAAVLVFVTLAAAALARIAVDQRRAASAADLAALAGATSLQHGRPGCPAALRVAGDNGATLVGCREHGERIVVDAVVRTRVLGRSVALQAHAVAGPVRP